MRGAPALVVAAPAVPSTPAAAGGRPKVVWTEHLLYDGPPGPDIIVMVPTVVMGDCTSGV